MGFVPTARLRFVVRADVVRADVVDVEASLGRVLQQWWAPDLPGYMADPAVGEWREVPTVSDVPTV